MLIAVPSKGRAGKTKTDKALKAAVFYVPENEVEEYGKRMPNKIVPVPTAIKGITATRNWILDNTDQHWIQFIDDDVKKWGWVELMSETARPRPMTEEDWITETTKLFEIAEDMKFRLWGVASMNASRAVYPYKPFIWHTYVTGSCMGVVNNGKRLRFNESFPVKEDYELCLRCIRDDGGVVGARYIFWQNGHWTDEGGCKDYRTQEMEKKAIDDLVKEYPGLIRQVTRGGSNYSIHLDF